MHLRIEALEDRLAPAVISWINPAGGEWTVARNWSGGRVPTADDVAIIRTGNAPIRYATPTVSAVGQLDSDSPLLVSNGTLELGSRSRVGSILQGGGQLTLHNDGTQPSLIVAGLIRQIRDTLSLQLTSERDLNSVPVILAGREVQLGGRLLVRSTVPSPEEPTVSVLIVGRLLETAAGTPPETRIDLTSLTFDRLESPEAIRLRAGSYADGEPFAVVQIDSFVLMVYDPEQLDFDRFTLFELLADELAQSVEIATIGAEVLRLNLTLPFRPEVNLFLPVVAFEALVTEVFNGNYGNGGAASGNAEVVELTPLPPAMLLPTDLEALPFEDVAGSAGAESINLLTGQRPRARIVARGRQVAPVAMLGGGGEVTTENEAATVVPVPASRWLIDPTQPPHVPVETSERELAEVQPQSLSTLSGVLLTGWALTRRPTRKQLWPRI